MLSLTLFKKTSANHLGIKALTSIHQAFWFIYSWIVVASWSRIKTVFFFFLIFGFFWFFFTLSYRVNKIKCGVACSIWRPSTISVSYHFLSKVYFQKTVINFLKVLFQVDDVIDVVLLLLILTWNRFYRLFWCYCC